MLGQRRRRWTNINPTLGQRLLLDGPVWILASNDTGVRTPSKHEDGGPPLKQYWVNASWSGH